MRLNIFCVNCPFISSIFLEVINHLTNLKWNTSYIILAFFSMIQVANIFPVCLQSFDFTLAYFFLQKYLSLID